MSGPRLTYLLVVKRSNKQVVSLDLFTRVKIEALDEFKVRMLEESLAYRLKFAEGKLLWAKKLEYSERPYFLFEWYDEKYESVDLMSLFDSVAAIGIPEEGLSWLVRFL